MRFQLSMGTMLLHTLMGSHAFATRKKRSQAELVVYVMRNLVRLTTWKTVTIYAKSDTHI
jgi:hypothetical protein